MRTSLLALSLLLLLAACGGDEKQNEPLPPLTTPPDKVTVDHILIAVKSPRMPQGKTPEEAKEFAYDLLAQLEAGADWAALKSKHSADPPPGGPYTMVSDGAPAGQNDIPRGGMVKGFGDVSFSLRVGEMGIADFHPTDSPFGFHIVKRVK